MMPHEHVYPTLVLERTHGQAQGVVTLADLDRDVEQASPRGPFARVIYLTAKPHPQDSMLFGHDVWRNLNEALRAIVEPKPPLRTKLREIFAAGAASRFWCIFEKGHPLRPMPRDEVPAVVREWTRLHHTSTHQTFLVEMADDQPSDDLDAWLAVMRKSMAIAPDATITTSTIDANVSVGLAPAPSTPEQLAIARRDALLARARAEAWPESDAVGQMLGSQSPTAGRQRATRERAAGHLLGLWSAGERTFYHPRFQFLPDGRVHPKLSELLEALAQLPAYAPEDDPGGWGRIAWLYGSSPSLSQRSLAEAATEGGIAPHESALDPTPRTPADVFPTDPDAVIALAREHAAAIRDRHG